MNAKRITLGVLICAALLMGWQYRSQIAERFSKSDGKTAEASVAEMFDCWANKRYQDLENVTFNRGPGEEMFLNMVKTPITFKDLMIGKARNVEKDAWFVPVSLKLTDPASAMSSLINYENIRPSLPKTDFDLIMPPKGEALKYIDWAKELLVFCRNGKECAVDVCRNNENCRRSDNPLNYAMDAGRVALDDEDTALIARLTAKHGNESKFRMVLWAKHAMFNLDIDEGQADVIAERAYKLFLRTPGGKLEIIKTQMRKMRAPDPFAPAVEPAPEENAAY